MLKCYEWLIVRLSLGSRWLFLVLSVVYLLVSISTGGESVSARKQTLGSFWKLLSDQNDRCLRGWFRLWGNAASIYITSLINLISCRRERWCCVLWCVCVCVCDDMLGVTWDGGGSTICCCPSPASCCVTTATAQNWGVCVCVYLPLLLPCSGVLPSAATYGSSLNLRNKP